MVMEIRTTPRLWNTSYRYAFLIYPPNVVILPSGQALELGDAVCLFPEGMSRFHPTIAPLKTGGI